MSEESLIQFYAGPTNGSHKRLISASRGDEEVHRDFININADADRRRFLGRVTEKANVSEEDLIAADEQLLRAADAADEAQEQNESNSQDGQKSQADKIVELGDNMELFHDLDGEAFATFPLNGHSETWPIHGRDFKQHLARLFYEQFRKAPGSQALQDALAVLEGRARFEGTQHNVELRCGQGDREIFIDLCNDGWHQVKITSEGWEMQTDQLIKFRRTNGMLPLVTPESGGSIQDLLPFLNMSDDDKILLLGWLINAMRPKGPYPILVLNGEQGTSKSTVTKMLRCILDPNKAPLRSEPRNMQDLCIAANNSHVISFDNFSYIKQWLSDTLCRLSTGGGFSTRALYSNADEHIMDTMAPVIINGIEELATRSDLLDRSIILTLDRIPRDQRRTEDELWSQFNEVLPRIVGGLNSAVSTAMRRLENVVLPHRPRMADFATWVTAAEPAMGLNDGDFLRIYEANLRSANTLALEATPVASAVLALLTGPQCPLEWRGTATELFRLLDVQEHNRRQQGWPRSPKGLTGILRRIAPNLRHVGVFVEFRHSGQRLIELTYCAEDNVQCVQTVQQPPTLDGTDAVDVNSQA